MSATVSYSTTPVWRRGADHLSGKDLTSTTWRSSKSPSPQRSRQTSHSGVRDEKGRSTRETWPVGAPGDEGKARGLAQRKEDRNKREAKLKQLYGAKACPAEVVKKDLYKQLKTNTNAFITWLVEAVHPGDENLPSGITRERDPKHLSGKYRVTINYLIHLAENLVASKAAPVHTIKAQVSNLDVVIQQRSEFSYWMARSFDNDSVKDEEHQHFIDTMEDVRTILSHHCTTSIRRLVSQTDATLATKPAPTSIQRKLSMIGKRRRSAGSPPLPEQRKAVKTTLPSSTPSPTPSTSSSPPPPSSAPKSTLILRNIIPLTKVTADKSDKVIEQKCSPVIRKSWANVAAVAV